MTRRDILIDLIDFLEVCASKAGGKDGVARFLKDFQDFKDMQDFFGAKLFSCCEANKKRREPEKKRMMLRKYPY